MSDQKKSQPTGSATAADWDALQKSQPSDYDGHTGFARMSPDARLRWLDQAVEFVARHKGEATKRVVSAKDALAEEQAPYDGIPAAPGAADPDSGQPA